MLGQSFLVSPCPRVVDQDGVVDPVLRVVDGRPVFRIDHPHDVAVDDQALVVFVDPDGAVERAVHRVPTQQRRPLLDVVGATEQNHVLRLLQGFHMTPDDMGTGFADEIHRRDVFAPLLALHQPYRQLADVGVGRTEIKLRQRLDDRIALELRQFVLGDLANETVRLHDVGHTAVVQRAPVTIDDDVLAVEVADDGDHRLRQRLALLPVGEVVL